MTEHSLRQSIVRVARQIAEQRLSPGASGNVSGRVKGEREGFLITPTGVMSDVLEPDHLVFMNLDGSVPEGQLRPSSEWRFHQAIYQSKPEAGGIVHTHSPSASTLACAGQKIPAFHYMISVAGGDDIPCAPYATFGTEELSRSVIGVLGSRSACLMANHGQVAHAPTVEEALVLATHVEWLAEQYIRVLQIGGPRLLSKREMTDVMRQFDGYGQQDLPEQ